MVYKKLGINRRQWCDEDRKFWQPYGLTSAMLEHFNVFPVEKVFLQNRQNYSYTPEDPAYAYYFGKQQFKIYFPYRKMFRFLCNTDVLQGFDQLPVSGKLLIITKALKDVMCLNIIEYPAIAPQGETVRISEAVMKSLRERFDEIIVFYDNDEAGFIGAEKIQDEHDLSNIIIPEHLGVKDISDFMKQEGEVNSLELMHELLDRPFT
jgi:hypothetical protein